MMADILGDLVFCSVGLVTGVSPVLWGEDKLVPLKVFILSIRFIVSSETDLGMRRVLILLGICRAENNSGLLERVFGFILGGSSGAEKTFYSESNGSNVGFIEEWGDGVEFESVWSHKDVSIWEELILGLFARGSCSTDISFHF